jgi:hypothetical protein
MAMPLFYAVPFSHPDSHLLKIKINFMYGNLGPKWFWRLLGICAVIGIIAACIWIVKGIIWLINHVQFT